MIGGANPVAGGGPVVLGLDTATASSAVALRLADGSTTQARDDPRPGEHPGHATRLLEMAHELLDEAGRSWSVIERIAVGVGPGTFTGLRVGVATARGLAQSLSAELVGVSSLQALASAALATEPSVDSVLAVIDARRGEVFAATYGRSGETAPARALAPEGLSTIIGEVRSGRWLAVGDGALRYPAAIEALGVPAPPADSPLHLVSAAAICALGVHATPASGLEEIVPDYRRRPDAELALAAAGARRAPRS
ncbi:MAG TPA: tRNA (adenosine(37)-N6)-threonylcarbamoyltransferase complex dimerization subunit type 1 TsaB [Solirubrobacteraceae bacterium]|nr:tRNA (adenosine(37)-N6)-threonylcarbamoyltransferase complex dimerization subunit type 1 TsaB [Solirubrobacteraceae bacterium]